VSKPKQAAQQPNKKVRSNAPGTSVKPEGFSIPYPLLWLAAAVVIVYLPTLYFGLTELDDSIFIREFHDYNENLQNLVTSFHRGLFDPLKDPYYRPLFMDSMIINYQWSDHGQNVVSYHIINVLLHIGSVLLLYKLFLKLNIKEIHAFILCLVFAVHPVLSQNVAWIPGRNDTLLAIFILSFLLSSIDYSNTRRSKSLLLSALFLILAFFTKETAVFAAPVAFVLLVFVLHRKWLGKNNLIQYCLWLGCFLLWYFVRAGATIQTNITAAQIVHDFIPRLPLFIQYIGKVFLPFNLSVFPIQQDTVYYYGIAAIVLLIAIVVLGRQKNIKTILSGLIIFILFLLPVLFVPNNLNEQSFEHRLYLPIIGILLLLPQTILFRNKFTDKQLLIGGIAAAALLAILNYNHQKNFADPVSFWTAASETSPHSAYALMMLAARTENQQESFKLFRKAYELNPKEKYLNFYYGVMLQKQDSVQQSEPYLLKEKNTSGYYECDFYLARVAMERKDFAGAINYLQAYLKTDKNNQIANNNLLLLYIDTRQPEKAKEQVKKMQSSGLEVPQQILQNIGK
jgi:protein O-mannosyl-transferase